MWCTWCVLCLRWVGVGSHLVRRRVAIGKLGSSQSTSKNAWCWVGLRWVVLGQWCFQWAESKGGAGCFLSEGGRGPGPATLPSHHLFFALLSHRGRSPWRPGGWSGGGTEDGREPPLRDLLQRLLAAAAAPPPAGGPLLSLSRGGASTQTCLALNVRGCRRQ